MVERIFRHYATKTSMKLYTLLAVIAIMYQESVGVKRSSQKIIHKNKDAQKIVIERAREECERNIASSLNRKGHCNATFDGIVCWPSTAAGTIAKQLCPHYVHGFTKDTNKKAWRKCMPTGSWFIHPELNTSWSNYTECVHIQKVDDHLDHKLVDPLIKEHIGYWVMIYNIGYSFSIVFLLVAIVIMACFKRLHCRRNILHMNLFVSFVLRSAISIVRDNLLEQGLALPRDVEYTDDGQIVFIVDASHWECKALFTTVYYIWFTSYMWIFMEGVYLYTLIFVSVFVDRANYTWCFVFGWGTGIVFLIPWVVVRFYLEDELCWNTHRHQGYFWILKAPVVASIMINFVLFIRIVIALFVKLTTSGRQHGSVRYRRLARSTLVLIPLFGVHYIVTIVLPDNVNVKLDIAKIYIEFVFSSFHGFIVAILFCFMNSEVQSELGRLLCCKRSVTNDQSATFTSNVPANHAVTDCDSGYHREMTQFLPKDTISGVPLMSNGCT